MKNIKLIIAFLCLLPLAGFTQTADFTAVSTPAYCVTDGTITVTATNTVGKVQYELVSYIGVRALIGVPQDDPFFLNLAPGTYMVGVYDDNNATTPIKKPVVVEDRSPSNSLTIASISSTQLAYCTGSTDPGTTLYTTINGGSAPYDIAVLDAGDNIVNEIIGSYNVYNNFPAIAAGTYKIRVKDNCGTIVNSNSSYVVKPNIVYDFTVAPFAYWYRDNNVKVVHSGAGTICDPVTDAYYDFYDTLGVPVITGNDVYPISQGPGVSTRMYAVEYDGVKTPYMTYDELRAYKQPLPLDINAWKPMTVWVTICGVEKSTVYNLPSRKNDFLPKLIENAGITFYLADDKANTLCTPTGYVTLSRFSLLSGFCDPLTLTITEKNGAEPTKQYTITGATQNDFEAQLLVGNTYILKLTDANGSELNRFSYINVTGGKRINMSSQTEVFLDPALFRPYNQDELPFELASMADFKNFGKSQLGIKEDSYIPTPYTLNVTGSNGYNLTKTINTTSIGGVLISDNLEVGDYSVHVTSLANCYDRTFPITLDRVINSVDVSTTIAPDPVACDRYVKTMNYRLNYTGTLRPYPSNGFEYIFKAPTLSFNVAEGPAGYSYSNSLTSWNMSMQANVTAVFRGDIAGLYKINLVENYSTTNIYGGPWEVDVKSEFPVFDMNGSGGAICTGSTTGTLGVVVKNAVNPVYYLKKATDANYPAVGQSSSYFPNLTAGDYMVKVETACYPTALETSFKLDYISNIDNIIDGQNVLCDAEPVNFAIKSLGPIISAEWKLPDGSTQTTKNLVVDNPQAGEYSVKVTTRSGCIVEDTIEVIIKTKAVLADVSANDAVICSGETTTLQATTAVIVNPLFTWYSDANLTNALGTGANFNTPVLTTDTIYYVTVQSDDFCENIPAEARVVKVMVNPTPVIPTGNAAQEFCAGAIVANIVTNENNVIWYTQPIGGTIVPDNTPLTNSTTYYGELKLGTCVSPSRLAVTVQINRIAIPADIIGANDLQLCEGSGFDLIVSSSVANPIYTWYSDAALTNIIASGENFGDIPTVTTTYYVTVKGDGICENASNNAKEMVVTVNPTPITPTGNATQEFCLDANATISDLVTNESNVIWYDAASAGNVIAAGTILVNGTIYYGSLKVGTCESAARLAVTAIVNEAKTPTGNTTQEFCLDANATILDLATNESNVIWYDAASAGNVIAAGTILVNGTIYYGSLQVGTCESTTRLAVTAIVNDAKTPTGNATQEFCLAANATISDLVTNESNVIWYDAASAGNVIAAGTVLVNGTIYYGSLQVGTCESATRLAVTAIVNEALSPTGNATQEFCSDSNATISDLVTNESNVIWYDAANAGNAIAAGTTLVNGTIYYGSLQVGTCESVTRLAVTAIVNEALSPTGNATQEFCLAANATISDLVTNESNLIWYDAANAGNAIAAGTTLVNGIIYYGSLKVGTCESAARLAVNAIVNDAKTPTGNTTQEFCLAANATISDLVTNESNVIWYDAANAGNAIAAGTTLVNGTIYYGALKVGTCESATRLAVTAIVKNDIPGEVINWTPTACSSDEVTYTTTKGMSNYNWLVSTGIITAGGQLNDDFVTVKWTTAGSGAVGVEFINPSNCDPIVTIHFPITITVCSDIAIGKTVNNATPTIGENVIFTITARNIGSADFQKVTVDEMLPSGYSYVIATTSSGSYNSTTGVWNLPILTAGVTETLTITAKVKGTGDYLNIAYLSTSTPKDPNPDNNSAEASVTPTGVIVHNAISPNGDGLNDHFKIEGIEHYPNNSVEIYNRWGVKIYDMKAYGSSNNVFRGISEGRATVSKGETLPVGTYFYILRYGKSETEALIEKSGYLYIN